MNNRTIEFLVGCFVLAGLAAVLYLALQVGGSQLFNKDSYELKARFSSATGVNPGSRIEIAGVRVGTVSELVLSDNFFAIATLKLPNSIRLDDDTIASIKTAGIIGERFVELDPGGSGLQMEPGEMIVDTESALDIESLISRFALGGIDEGEE